MANLTRYVYIPLAVTALLVSAFFLLVECSQSICRTLFSQHITYFKSFLGVIPKISVIILLFFVFRLAIFIAKRIFMSKFVKEFHDEARVDDMFKVFSIAMWFAFVVVSLSILVGNLGALLTSIGLIGFGLTFALQKPILNFVGWLTILIKGIYRVGDRIRVGTIRGDVIEIQLMNTVVEQLLETSDLKAKKILTFPNEFVLTMDVSNFTKNENYVFEELQISITYESDYHKAMKLLGNIVTNHIKQNQDKYIKTMKAKQVRINQFMERLTKQLKSNKKHSIRKEMVKLEKDRQDVMQDIKQARDMDDEFNPRIRAELADSSINLVAQFITPYDKIKKNRTAIFLAFMDAIKKEKNIEIAYPHMELVYHGKK